VGSFASGCPQSGYLRQIEDALLYGPFFLILISFFLFRSRTVTSSSTKLSNPKAVLSPPSFASRPFIPYPPLPRSPRPPLFYSIFFHMPRPFASYLKSRPQVSSPVYSPPSLRPKRAPKSKKRSLKGWPGPGRLLPFLLSSLLSAAALEIFPPSGTEFAPDQHFCKNPFPSHFDASGVHRRTYL